MDYNFECEKCSRQKTISISSKDYDKYVVEEVLKEDVCDCGGDYKRVYSFNLGPDIYRNDPTSKSYWKQGKTASQCADVIASDKVAPY